MDNDNYNSYNNFGRQKNNSCSISLDNNDWVLCKFDSCSSKCFQVQCRHWNHFRLFSCFWYVSLLISPNFKVFATAFLVNKVKSYASQIRSRRQYFVNPDGEIGKLFHLTYVNLKSIIFRHFFWRYCLCWRSWWVDNHVYWLQKFSDIRTGHLIYKLENKLVPETLC